MEAFSEISAESHPDELKSIVSRFENSVKQYTGSPAIVSPHQPADLYGFESLPMESSANQAPHLRWSYQTLGRSVIQLKEGLITRGADTKTVLFAFCESQVESVICTLAAHTAGWVHVPIGPEYLRNPKEVQHMITAVTESTNPAEVVFVAAKQENIEQIDQIHTGCNTIKACCGKCPDSWVPFDSLVGKSISTPEQSQQATNCSPNLTVFFTSGTTSLPKACLIDTARWLHALEPSLTPGSVVPGDLFTIAVPFYHAFGYICTMMPLLRGAGVVLIGPKFSPQAMATALRLEACTHAALVPTMVHSLVQMFDNTELEVQSLRGVILAGMTVTSNIVRKCQELLGVSTVENYYGMTEGVFVSTGPVEDLNTTMLNDTASIGKPISGAKVRVCDEDGHSPVPVGVTGVLHFSGPTMIEQYLDYKSEDFYESEDRVWFVTGDRAFMGHDKQLYIVGRHKDMIIRGGENLAPVKIEELLMLNRQSLVLEPQVVAGQDAIAGEVPIVVTKVAATRDVENMMHQTIRENLGLRYLPRAFISLNSLGLDDFPRTAAGKIQKPKLRKLVADFMQSEASEPKQGRHSPAQLFHDVVTVWSRLLGLESSHLDITAPVTQIADSILMLSARVKIKHVTGRSVPLAQWLVIPTIADEIKVLGGWTADSNTEHTEEASDKLRSGPPSTGDMVHLGEDESAFNATKEAIEKTIVREGLSWEDVEDVFPCTDFMQILCRSQVINTWNIRTTILSKSSSVQAMRTALEETLLKHPIMRSYLIVNDEVLGKELGLYVIMRQNKRLLEQCILNYGTVDTLEELRSVTMNYPFKDHAKLPGPLFRCLVVFVRETNSAALVTNAAHATLDITYLSMILEDLDRALGCQPLWPRPYFKTWADTYHILRRSPAAGSAVKFYTEYLRDLKDHTQALWPNPTAELMVSPERAAKDGHVLVFPAPSFVRLRQQYPMLTAPIILKAALALTVILHTNHTHALFLNLEAQRTRFPFLTENSPFNGIPEAAEVAGPTFGGALNLVKFQPTETVLEYLMRIQKDQENLTKHAAAPWHEISNQLRRSMQDILPTVAESLIFNWMPGLGPAILGENPYRHMNVTQTHIRTKLGMLASAGAGGPDGSQIVIYLQGALANMSSFWVERAAEEMKNIALWLADEDSLQMSVGEFTKSITPL